MLIQNLIKTFQEKEHNKRSRKGKGTYLHFDNRLKLTPGLINYITSPRNIARHSFYPFIHGTISVKKYDKTTGKVKKKDREIFYAAHRDAYIYSWYSVVIGDRFEKLLEKEGLSKNVIAYRKISIGSDSASNTHFAVEVFDFIKKYGECTTLAFDIHHFFDNIDHELLKKFWVELLEVRELPIDHYKIFRTLTKFSYVNRKSIFRKLHIRLGKNLLLLKRYCTTKEFDEKIRSLIKKNENNFGIPQGSPMSALLSNVYLNKFDIEIKDFVDKFSGLYRRYSDDIIIVCRKQQAEEATKMVMNLLAKYKLEINEKKTEVVNYAKQNDRLIVDSKSSNRPKLQYLGYEFDGQNFYIRSSSLSRYFRKMKRGIKVAFSKGIKNKRGDKIYLRSIYRRYSHLGSSNFISYAKRAYKITGSEFIKKQIKRHWQKMKQQISKFKKGA